MISVWNPPTGHNALIFASCMQHAWDIAVADPGGLWWLKPPPPTPKFKMFWECSGPTAHDTWFHIHLSPPPPVAKAPPPPQLQNPGSAPAERAYSISWPTQGEREGWEGEREGKRRRKGEIERDRERQRQTERDRDRQRWRARSIRKRPEWPETHRTINDNFSAVANPVVLFS